MDPEKDKKRIPFSALPENKKAIIFWGWFAGVGVTVSVICWIVSIFFPEYFASTSQPVPAPSNSGNDSAAILMVIVGGMAWLIQKVSPYALFGIVIAFFSWGISSWIRDAVKDGISEALDSYGVKENLKEIIKESIEESRASGNKNYFDQE